MSAIWRAELPRAELPRAELPRAELIVIRRRARAASLHTDLMDMVASLRSAEQPFVLAAVVRTVSATAAKAGAKAAIRPDGTVAAGWIGGGCADRY